MVLKLDFSIKDRPWFPVNEHRPVTEFEARVDYLMLHAQKIELSTPELMDRWHWTAAQITELVNHMHATNFLQGDWYQEEATTSRKETAAEIIAIYKEVIKRKVQLNDHRVRLINARIAEGKKYKQTIGPAQFRAVFEFKKKEWTGTEQEKYLTIETLCAAKHFNNYLEQAREDYKRKLAESRMPKQEEVKILPGKIFNE